MIGPRPRHPFFSAEEASRLNSFAPDILKVLRPDAPPRADGCNLRFGNKGSLLIRSTGTWSDFEAGKNGHGALALIAHLRACSLEDPLVWAHDWLAQHPGQGSFSIAPDDDEADAGERDTIARSTFSKRRARSVAWSERRTVVFTSCGSPSSLRLSSSPPVLFTLRLLRDRSS